MRFSTLSTMIAGLLLASPSGSGAATPPRPDHVVIVMEENHSFKQVTKSTVVPYLHMLAAQGANFTDSHGVRHPSEPNYFALFSGSTQGARGDGCKYAFDVPNLATELIAAGLSFGAYAESLPSVGSTVCATNEGYARKHNPSVSFTNVPTDLNMPFTSFPSDYSQLPTVSIVIPNQRNDMHSGPMARADAWLQTNLDGYVQWAMTHNSLLIVTWDEGGNHNSIPTIFVGPMVQVGPYSERIDHYDVLRTIEEMYGLPPLGFAAERLPILDVWACTPTTCAAQGADCGSITDGCAGTLDCGSCTTPQTCGGSGTANVCG